MNDKEIIKIVFRKADKHLEKKNPIHNMAILDAIYKARKDEREKIKKEIEDLPRWEPSVAPFWKGAIMKCEDNGRYVNIIHVLDVLSGGEVSVNAPLKGQITRVKKGLPAGMQKPEKRTKRFFDDLFGLPRKKEKYE
jgi:hypothetical protein